jgi:hypothetical protein
MSGYSSLAYDPTDSILYSFDANNFLLHAIDPTTGNDVKFPGGQTGPIRPYIAGGGGTYLQTVLGLAFNPATSVLYLSDTSRKAIYAMNPAVDPYSAQLVTTPNSNTPFGGSGIYSELQFYDGQLYGTFEYFDNSGIEHSQLRRIDLATGQTVDIGSPIDDASIHSLLIDSLPEAVQWSVVSGPGTVTFADPTDPTSSASFSAPGIYILQLAASGNGNEIFDTVQVTVPEPGEAVLLVAGLLGLVATRRQRGAAAI